MDERQPGPERGGGVFTPIEIGPLKLRNRVIKAATFEGMTPGGLPSDDLVEHHRRVAAGGAGMTTVAYCSVSPEGLTFPDQMHMRPEIVPGLSRLTAAVHHEGATAALQLGHAGYFASRKAAGCRPVGASRVLNLYTLTRPRVMNPADMERIRDDFAKATTLAAEAGFDAVEVHLGHGYLLSQFLSPYTNRRRDMFGGDIEARLRFPIEVVKAVRGAAGSKMAVLVKANLEDGFKGGLGIEEAIEVARALEANAVDAIVLSGGFVSRTPFYMLRGDLPVAEMVRNEKKRLRRIGLRLFGRIFVKVYPFEEMFFFEQAQKVRRAVKVPLCLLGGIRSLANIEKAMSAGFDLISMGRPLILDPDLVLHMKAGKCDASVCEPCNLCVARMEAGGIICAHPRLGAS